MEHDGLLACITKIKQRYHKNEEFKKIATKNASNKEEL